jgi:hypothetical protein
MSLRSVSRPALSVSNSSSRFRWVAAMYLPLFPGVGNDQIIPEMSFDSADPD